MNFAKDVMLLLDGGDLDIDDVDLFKFMVFLAQNRLLYWFVLHYETHFDGKVRELLSHIATKGKLRSREFDKTVGLINAISVRHDLKYAITKKKRDYPYISCDVDLLVSSQQYEDWIDAFRNEGFSIGGHGLLFVENHQQNILRKDLFYKIDITTQFDWQGSHYFDTEFLWDNCNDKDHELSAEAEFLVNLGAIAFKRMSLSLIDCLYLGNVLRNGNLKLHVIEDQASKYGWEKSYRKVVNFILSADPNRHDFPRLFPSDIYLEIFYEKLMHGKLSLNYILYFVLARLRYYILGKKHVPFHVYWYPYGMIKSIKHNI